MNLPRAEELWSKLASAGLTVGGVPDATEAHTPWYVRAMLGIAGFLAAGFLLGFVGVGFAFVMKSHTASLSVGFMVIVAAYGVFRMAPRNDFSSMFGLAVSFAGQALVAFGILGFFERHLTGATPWVVLGAIEATLAVVMPNFIHRVVAAFGSGFAFAYACEISGVRGVETGGLAAVVAFAWLQEMRLGKFHALVAPIGYGLTLAFIEVEGSSAFRHSMAPLFEVRQASAAYPWIGEALVAAALLASVWVLLRRAGRQARDARTILALIAAAVVGAASFRAPGVAGGLMVVLLGFGNGNRVLVGLGIAALLVYVSGYYYVLDATLLAKSGVLAATGAVLLAVRRVVLKFVTPQEGASA